MSYAWGNALLVKCNLSGLQLVHVVLKIVAEAANMMFLCQNEAKLSYL